MRSLVSVPASPAPRVFLLSAVPFTISSDPSLLDVDVIHGFLATCYWSPGIARERVERAVTNSLCFGVYDASSTRAGSHLPAQVGFARVVTDRASFAYLCDVFVLDSHRGRGLSKALMRAVLDHPDVQGVRRFCLLTRDAHGLYARFGFAPMEDPTRFMEIIDRESYKRP